MLEPLSLNLSGAKAPPRVTGSWGAPDSGCSRDAGDVRAARHGVVDRVDRSIVLGWPKVKALSDLTALADECAESDWNGEGAEPINLVALEAAKRLIRLLPDELPIPRLSVDPDGAVSMGWMGPRRQRFSLSAGPRDRLAYAWLDGVDRGHAVAHFDHRSVPTQLLATLRAMLAA